MLTEWYYDGDGDGYPLLGSLTIENFCQPSPGPGYCCGNYYTNADRSPYCCIPFYIPEYDCDDNDSEVYGTGSYFYLKLDGDLDGYAASDYLFPVDVCFDGI